MVASLVLSACAKICLQEVYGKLEEPDGLAGLLRLRQGPPRLQDQLLAAEKAGSWSEALALHEQVSRCCCCCSLGKTNAWPQL